MARAINPLSGRFKTGYLPFFASGNGAWAVPRWVLGFCGLLLCATVCLGQSAPADDSGVDPKAESASVFDRVISNQKRLEADLNVFERVERVEIRKTASDPNPSEVKVWRVFPAGTGTDKIPLAADGKPGNPQSYREALQRLETALIWAAQDGMPQKEAYNKLARRQKERNDLIDATRNAFFFTRIGEERRGDRALIKYEMIPNPAYKPTTRNEMLLTKVRGTLWIDKESLELAKIEGHVTEDISLALFLAKIYRGSYFMQERYEIASGVWLPTYQQYDFDGRKFLIPFSIHERSFYSDYRRVGPPKEALKLVRDELSKLQNEPGNR